MSNIPHSELPSMVATLCSYENCFGPYHPQTLQLTTTVAVIYGQCGDCELAVRLLERVLRDVQRIAGRDTGLRLRAAIALRDLWLQRQNASDRRSEGSCGLSSGSLGPGTPRDGKGSWVSRGIAAQCSVMDHEATYAPQLGPASPGPVGSSEPVGRT